MKPNWKRMGLAIVLFAGLLILVIQMSEVWAECREAGNSVVFCSICF